MQPTREGNQPGERRPASGARRLDERPIVSDGIAEEAGYRPWRSPEAPRRQQRRGKSDRNSERSGYPVGARVFCEAKRDTKKNGFATAL